MKRMYLSLPISGRELDAVKERVKYIKEIFISDEYELVSPFDICPDSTLPYNELMGRDIAGLMECDAILLDFDWNESKGCRTELAVAEIYGKRVYRLLENKVCESLDKQRFTLELNKRQLEILSDACDNHSRNMSGQLDIGLSDILEAGIAKEYETADFEHRHQIRERAIGLLREIKILVWNMGAGASYGVGYDEKADILYDIHQVIRHYLWKLKPEPRPHTIVSSSPAIQFGKEPLVVIKKAD